jgi:hypothetical protein
MSTPQEQVKELQAWETTNNFDLVDLAKEWANCREARVDDHGDVWIEDPQTGHWLEDDDLLNFVDWVEGKAGPTRRHAD